MPRRNGNRLNEGEVDLEPENDNDPGGLWDMRRHAQGLQERSGSGVPSIVRWIASLIAIALLVGLVLAFVTERVDATESCVITSFGREVGTAGPGLHFATPDKEFNCYTIRQRTMELVEGDPIRSNSRADYVDWAIKARTVDGIDIWSMLTLQYHIAENAPEKLYPTYPNDEAVKEQLVKSRLRSIVPQTLSLTGAEHQYLGNIGPISDDIEKQLKASLEPFGIAVDYFELKRSDFDDRYEEAIRARAVEVENAKLKELAQVTAKNESERLRIETEGKTAAQKQQADTDRYVAQQKTDAATYDLEQRAAALAENPELIEWEKTQAIRDANAVYLPNDVLPIFDVPAPPTPVEG